MLAVLFFLGASSLIGLGAPVVAPSSAAFDALEPIDGIRFVTNYRSTPRIIWTCIVTTFLCTWVSIHPDIVGYNSKARQRILLRVLMFLVTFTTPELTLLFAAAQWMIAHDIVRKFGGRKSLWARLRTRLGNLVVRVLGEKIAKKIDLRRRHC